MRRQPRQNVFANGTGVAQDFSTADLAGNAYPKSAGIYTPRTINHLARYEWTFSSDGIPRLSQVVNTIGPEGGLVCLPPDPGTTRKLAQWGRGGVPCLVTNVSPLKVRPIRQNSGGSPFLADTSLNDITVVAPTSYAPTVGDAGALYQGSDLQSEQFVFLPFTVTGGGGGGSVVNYYGDGVDGPITPSLSGVTNWNPYDSFASGTSHALFIGGSTHFNDDSGVESFVAILNRDLYCTTFTVPATITLSGSTLPFILITSGYKILATTSITVNGHICNDGWILSGGIATPGSGSTLSPWTSAGRAAASWGGGRYQAGANPNPPGYYMPFPQDIANNTGSGASGASGFSPATGTGQGYYSTMGPGRSALLWLALSQGDPSRSLGDFVGGCAGADSGGGGAVGGAGGAPVVLSSPSITGSGKVTSNGRAGFPGTGGAQGGGGGGNPGPILLIGDTVTVATSSVPGAGGAHSGAGYGNGSAGGGTGLVRKFAPTTGVYS